MTPSFMAAAALAAILGLVVLAGILGTLAVNRKASIDWLNGRIDRDGLEIERLRQALGQAQYRYQDAERDLNGMAERANAAETALVELCQNMATDSFDDDVEPLPTALDPMEAQAERLVEVPYTRVRVVLPELCHDLALHPRALYLARGAALAERMGQEATWKIKLALGIAAAEQMK